MPLSRRAFQRTLVAGGASLAAASALGRAAEPKGEWRSLFDGKSLDGWTPKLRGEKLGSDERDTFRFADGLIQVRYDKYDDFGAKFGHLFFKEPFSKYRLRIEYRFVGPQCKGGPGWATRNSGVMIHGQPPETMDVDQDFPVSIEVQFLGGDGKSPRTTGNLCTPGTHVVYNGKLHKPHCTGSSSKTIHGDEWVAAEVEAHGFGKIVHRINGETVLEYEQPQYDPDDGNAKKLIKGGVARIEGGSISLQAESHPIDFRKVEIMELD
ncbi:MAG: 3-keto-disaccharide hydrolase [Planctomycetia bacterium]